jgi:hypothetical protein
MRLMIIVLTLAALVFVDYYKFNGYYGSQVSQFLARTIRSVT